MVSKEREIESLKRRIAELAEAEPGSNGGGERPRRRRRQNADEEGEEEDAQSGEDVDEGQSKKGSRDDHAEMKTSMRHASLDILFHPASSKGWAPILDVAAKLDPKEKINKKRFDKDETTKHKALAQHLLTVLPDAALDASVLKASWFKRTVSTLLIWHTNLPHRAL
jgi:hypothetical protein